MSTFYYRVFCVWYKTDGTVERSQIEEVEIEKKNINSDKSNLSQEIRRVLLESGLTPDDIGFIGIDKKRADLCEYCDNLAETDTDIIWAWIRQAMEQDDPYADWMAFVCDDCADKILGFGKILAGNYSKR